MSLNNNDNMIKVHRADVPRVVCDQAFPELAGLCRLEKQAQQDKKDWEEMLEMAEMRLREWEIERLRNDLIMLNIPKGGHSSSSPQQSPVFTA